MFNNPAAHVYTRPRKQIRWQHWLVMAILVPVLVILATATATAANTPGVFPPDTNPYGLSYGEWSTRWWQYASGIPATYNPLFDETGANCAAGQSGNVWFLSGKFLFAPNNTATRYCTMPKDTALFFPILSAENDNFTCLDPDTHLSISELRAAIQATLDTATDLAVEVDGVALPNLAQYRVASPVFSITLPENNFIQAVGCTEGAGVYGPAVSDGYWVMLKPLAVGQHTVHFHGTLFGSATLDITYHLTVVNQRKSQLRAFVYNDKTNLGRFNGGDKALQGWDVTIYDANGVQVGTARTNAQGKVSFPLLTPGAYTLCEGLLPGWNNTQPATVDPTYGQPCYTQTLNPGQVVEVRFGNHRGAVSASEIKVGGGVVVTDLVEAASTDEATVTAEQDGWLTTEEVADEAEPETAGQTIHLPVISR